MLSSPTASDPAVVHFRYEFPLSIPFQPQSVGAVADLAVRLGVPEMDRVSVFLPGAAGRTRIVTVGPRTDIARRALREIRGSQSGAIRRWAFELATADAEIVELIPTRFMGAEVRP